ncbi:SPOR domain-containing protein [Vibrio crassostreae]|uniref:SPOR domain-containing protein n=1 Tax=Vibrio crassostreae TaxID=246167 RepID=UPI0007097E73|nr:SPOR domain-containing protein [Vibrio crassostreae]CAK2171087.1 SPOR domain-containing protein [Vibrio crassostreae]CAK2194403.1 SPOR domain-containing protein [Vibrio crassostreae]CAK2198732.1 SPOR domain-containing protein [Vibrio crassostreae]CAK2201562.1 SPOR domain-containing protein [Vibrio crassostreae]CAK2202890.1 SPOR domain-containing protein [Vibrio crassostreae]
MKLTMNAVCRAVMRNYRMGLIAASLLVSSQVSAESVLCDATQASTNQLPQLEQSCPIGKGVWGSKAPRRHSDNELFWVQCGLLNKPLSLNRAKPLYEKISTNVWMKPEGSDYRCLIGPYSTFSDARKELAQVRKVPGYGEAFIRMVDKSKTSSQPIVAKAAAPKAIESKAVKPKAPAKPKPVAKPAAKPVVAAQAATSAAAIQAFPSSGTSSNNDLDIEIRVKANVAGSQYAIPYLLDHQQQFYMEQGKPWSRLDYASAELVCKQVNMKLMTEKQWQSILGSKVMEKQNWPMHLPYWGADKKGLFTNGNVNQLKGSSLLNVMCVK